MFHVKRGGLLHPFHVKHCYLGMRIVKQMASSVS